jgi:P-type E1-E2 ATPase
MIEINIPGFGQLHLHHLVLDYNGTLACDGNLYPGVRETLSMLSRNIDIHILTADTFGTVRNEFAGFPCTMAIISKGNEHEDKLRYIEKLGLQHTICIGNGRNDRRMLQRASVGIAVVQIEGAAAEAVMNADVIVPDIFAALQLLVYPQRLLATLRS